MRVRAACPRQQEEKVVSDEGHGARALLVSADRGAGFRRRQPPGNDRNAAVGLNPDDAGGVAADERPHRKLDLVAQADGGQRGGSRSGLCDVEPAVRTEGETPRVVQAGGEDADVDGGGIAARLRSEIRDDRHGCQKENRAQSAIGHFSAPLVWAFRDVSR